MGKLFDLFDLVCEKCCDPTTILLQEAGDCLLTLKQHTASEYALGFRTLAADRR